MLKAAPRSTAGEVLAVLEAELDQLVEAPMPGLHAERLAVIARMKRLTDRLQALTSTRIAEADRQGSASIATGTSTTDWLSKVGHVDSKEAVRTVRAGQDLLAAPALKDAALAGTVTPAQASSIRKTLSELPEDLTAYQKQQATTLLLDKASTMTPSELGRQAKNVLESIAPDTPEDGDAELRRLELQQRRAHRRRKVAWYSDDDGSVIFNISLPKLEADGFIKLLDAYVGSHRSTGIDKRPGAGAEYTNRSMEYADALIAITARHSASGTVGGGVPAAPGLYGTSLPTGAGDRPRVVVTMDYTALLEQAEQAGVLSSGSTISAGELRRLCCDADITPVVLGSNSVPLDVGRTSRLVTPEIRKALTLRDGGCAFPGCHMPDPQCEAHHITPWWAGGSTALHNLVTLCGHHHKLVEPPRFWRGPPPDAWEVRISDGLPEFRPPDQLNIGRHWRPGNGSRE